VSHRKGGYADPPKLLRMKAGCGQHRLHFRLVIKGVASRGKLVCLALSTRRNPSTRRASGRRTRRIYGPCADLLLRHIQLKTAKVFALGPGACPAIRRSNKPYATTISSRSVFPESPWYGPVCPVVWEGWRREASPYPDLTSIPAVGFVVSMSKPSPPPSAPFPDCAGKHRRWNDV
jgi:hypothetical protein